MSILRNVDGRQTEAVVNFNSGKFDLPNPGGVCQPTARSEARVLLHWPGEGPLANATTSSWEHGIRSRRFAWNGSALRPAASSAAARTGSWRG